MGLFKRTSNDLAWGVVGACVAMYLVSAALSAITAPPGEAPIQYLFEPSTETLIGMGIGGSLPFHNHEFWTLITSTYLHANIIHILFNCLCLLSFFPIITQQFGKAKGFAIYTIAGIAGSLVSAFSGEIYSLGASGGVLGLYGAMIAYGIRGDHPARWAPVKDELLWAILTFAIGLSGVVNVSNAGHFGGLVGGLAAGLILGPLKGEQKSPYRSRLALGFMALTALSLAVGLSLAARETYFALNDRTAYDTLIADRRNTEVDESIRQEPGAANLRAERGLRRYQAGDQEGALADFSAAVDLDPSIDNLGFKAGTLYNLKRYDEALKVYDDILKAQPDNMTALFYRAGVFSDTNRFQNAAEDYSHIIDKGAANAETWNGRAWSYFQLSQLNVALADVEKALALKPDYAAALDTRAHIFEAMGERDKAIADYRAALLKDPSNTVSRDALNRMGVQ